MDGFQFIEVEYENGEMWRVKESLKWYDDDEFLPSFGDWDEQDANNPGCPAYGKLEAMAQNDDYADMICNTFSGNIKRVTIWKESN
jgi:hypothetical protein